MRRRLKEGLAFSGHDDAGQLALGFAEIGAQSEVYEYAVLVTSLDEEVLTLRPALSRSGRQRKYFRRNEEPMGLGRLHHARSAPAASSRRASSRSSTTGGTCLCASPIRTIPSRSHHQPAPASFGHRERTRHARQTTIRVASSHAKAGRAARVLSGIARFLRELVQKCGAVDGGPALAPDSCPRCPILAAVKKTKALVMGSAELAE